MKNKIVLVPFVFDDLSGVKVRPAVCLTDAIRPYDHVIIAFITSQVRQPNATDISIAPGSIDFLESGLKVASSIRIHHLATVGKRLIRREIGQLSSNLRSEVDEKLRAVFEL